MGIIRKLFLTSFVLIFTLLMGCNDPTPASKLEYSDQPPFQENIYLFGVHPLHNPKRLFEVYQPMIDFINARLQGGKLRLEASRNYAAFDKKLFDGYFDFALPNPYQTVTSLQHGYRVFGKMADDENFRGIILIRKDSEIETVSDLKGKSVSYPAPTALAATIMPQWFLVQNGLNIDDDITNHYVGSQESSIMNVYLGNTDAASTWPPPWLAFIKERPEVAEQVIVKWQTPPLLNNGLVVKESVPKAILDQVSQSIFNLHHSAEGQQILAAMELSQYEPATNETYSRVEKFLIEFEKRVRSIRLQP
ncbi:phosphonate ABC transporter substrate-binding protein [Hydrogenovibrio sp. SC-1]|uniref:phosphate/phosphite/phosphonate ABC transporter substrate-binding protein n=1 Tax=Hydrogenovibrio sp. SC-1 TaxID=2065820 RepID=UPI000C7D9931|nr:phosphate/phosphite/phosphonate ABC transporter substrate-binding protein [Hydrogenovibrio sp. SC-1]PLA75340.1 phosphonate ABC transporter substrate-binding protein [Hydrogenovibrio sp. SC-1]